MSDLTDRLQDIYKKGGSISCLEASNLILLLQKKLDTIDKAAEVCLAVCDAGDVSDESKREINKLGLESIRKLVEVL